MSHHNSEEDIALQAALHALGVLPEDEALAFQQHLEQGCIECQAEVESYQSTVEKLAFSVSGIEPSASVRDRLFQKIKGQPKLQLAPTLSKQELGSSLTIRADEGEWREKWKGVFIKRLFKDEAKGTVTTLYKMMPGASLQKHRHIGAEECFILEGDYHINGEILGAGDYHCALPDSVDETLFTINGTMFLLVSPERYAAV
jgi:anti-sigma factor ChrR (cupin superfamily)